MISKVSKKSEIPKFNTIMNLNISIYIKIFIISIFYLSIYFFVIRNITIDNINFKPIDGIIMFIELLSKINNLDDKNQEDKDKYIIIKYIILLIISLLIKICIIDKIYINIYKNIYNNSIKDNVYKIYEKYNIDQKSFLASNALKSLLLNQIYIKINIYILLNITLIYICYMIYDRYNNKTYKILEYILLSLVYLSIYFILIINMKNKFINNYIYITIFLSILIVLKTTITKLQHIDLKYIIYIIYIYYNVEYIKHNEIALSLKKFGNYTPNSIKSIIIENEYIYPFKKCNYTFNSGNIYIIPIINGIFIDSFFYNISNLYFHDKTFYIKDDINTTKYSKIKKDFWKDIVIIEENFSINNTNVFDYVNNIVKINDDQAEEMRKYLMIDVDLYKNIIWNNISDNEKYEIMLYIIFSTKSKLILIPDFLFDNLSNIQQQNILKLITDDRIFIIYTNKEVQNSNNIININF